MEIIKYEGNNECFFALIKEEKDYYLFTGKVINVLIDSVRDTSDEILFSPNIKFINEVRSKIEINLKKAKDDTLFKLFKLNSKEEYETIVSVVKSVL